MSLVRAVLTSSQAWANQLACTPPNPTPPNQRYHTEQHWILQIAPLIFRIHQYLAYGCALFEILSYLITLAPSSFSLPPLPLLPDPQQNPITLTPLAFIGVVCVLLGTYIRLDCFKALGALFTFDLTIHPSHTLITSRFYSYVRHPSYTGSLMVVAGLIMTHLTAGSWLCEVGPLAVAAHGLNHLFATNLKGALVAAVVATLWWIWTFSVGVSRARAEDAQMLKVFGQEWEQWAAEVAWWFFPGII